MDFNEVIPEMQREIAKLKKQIKALEDAAQPLDAVSKTTSKKD